MGVKPVSNANLSPARLAAVRILTRVWEEGAYAHEALTSVLKQSTLTDLERSETTRLAYGAIAYSSTLDYILAHFLPKPGGVKTRIRTALKLSFYELYFTPGKDYAVVSQGVELAKELHCFSSGLVNAVLRNALKERDAFPWDDSLSTLERQALSTGFPFWVAEKFAQEFGETKAVEIMLASSQPAPLYGFVPSRIRKPLKKSELAFEMLDAEMLPGTVCFTEPSAAVNHPLIMTRDVMIVDAVAQFVAQLYVSNFKPKSSPMYRAMEIGSGRGTKTNIAAYTLRAHEGDPQHMRLYAIDSHDFKTELTNEYAREHKLTEISAITVDATDSIALDAAILGEKVDALLIDAPCTGLGTLRRHPDKRAKLTPSDVTELAELSSNLLTAAAHVVKPGGQIIYATCTMTSEENTEVVTSFLESSQGSDWRIDPLTANDVPGAWKSFVTEKGFFQSFPEVDGPDGHFIARLVKAGELV